MCVKKRCVLQEKEWAKTHPWQSWRDHYKKNSEKFDEEIYNWQKAHPAKFTDGHGRDMRRNPPGRRRIPAKRLDRNSRRDEPDDDDDDNDEDDDRHASRNEPLVKQTFPPSRKRRQAETESEDEPVPPSSVGEDGPDYEDGEAGYVFCLYSAQPSLILEKDRCEYWRGFYRRTRGRTKVDSPTSRSSISDPQQARQV